MKSCPPIWRTSSVTTCINAIVSMLDEDALLFQAQEADTALWQSTGAGCMACRMRRSASCRTALHQRVADVCGLVAEEDSAMAAKLRAAGAIYRQDQRSGVRSGFAVL